MLKDNMKMRMWEAIDKELPNIPQEEFKILSMKNSINTFLQARFNDSMQTYENFEIRYY